MAPCLLVTKSSPLGGRARKISNFLEVNRYKVTIAKMDNWMIGKNMHRNMVQTRAASASMVRIYGIRGVVLVLALRSYENMPKSLIASVL